MANSSRDKNPVSTSSDSGLKTPLTTEEGFVASDPSACSDGHYIVFNGLSIGGKRTLNIWRMERLGEILNSLPVERPTRSPSVHQMDVRCFMWTPRRT